MGLTEVLIVPGFDVQFWRLRKQCRSQKPQSQCSITTRKK